MGGDVDACCGVGRAVQWDVWAYILDGDNVDGQAIHHSDRRQVLNLDGGSATTRMEDGGWMQCVGSIAMGT